MDKLKRFSDTPLFSLIFLIALGCGVFVYNNFVIASPFSFTQSSWNGGVTTNVPVHPTNQVGWTEFSTKNDINAGSTVSLGSHVKNFTDDGTPVAPHGTAPVGGGFLGGINSLTQVLGTGASADVELSQMNKYVVGSLPSFTAFDALHRSVWIANQTSDTVSKVNIDTGTSVQYPAGVDAHGVAYDSTQDAIWVANYGANTVTKLNAATGALIGTYIVGPNPYGIAFVQSNNTIWVTLNNSNQLVKVDAASGTVLSTISVGNYELGVAYDGIDSVWLANDGDSTVSKVNVISDAVSGPFSVGVTAHPLAFALDSSTGYLWVTLETANEVAVIDPATGGVLASYPGFFLPWGIAYDSTTNSMWVANTGNYTISKVDATNGAILKSYSVGDLSLSVVFDSLTNSVWMGSYYSNTINKLSVNSTAYVTPGVFTSAVIDFGEPSTFTTLSYTKNIPVNTTLSVEVQASVDGATWSGWSAVPANGDISFLGSTNQYIQYRVNMDTTDTAITPTLNDVTISSTYWTFIDDGATSTNGGVVPSGGGFGSGTNSSTLVNGLGAGSSVGLAFTFSKTDYPVNSDNGLIAFDNITPSIWVRRGNTVTNLNVTTGAVIGGPFTVYGSNDCQSSDIAFDSSSPALWVSLQGCNFAEKVNITTGVPTDVPLDIAYTFVAFDSYTNTIWMIDNSGGTVSKFGTDGTFIGNYPVGSGPIGIAFTSDSVWVTNYFDNTVTKLNNSGTLVGTYAVGASPYGVAFDSATNSIWVTSSGDSSSITKLNATTGATIGSPISFGANSQGSIAFDSFTNSIWVENSFNHTVTKIDSSTGTVLGTYPVGLGADRIVFDSATNSVWVANSTDNTVSKIGVTALYASSGTFESAVIDLGNFATFSTLLWGETKPLNTDITMEVRGSADNVLWSGWTAVSNGGDISTLNGDRFIQYRANLTTSDTNASPMLNNVTFNYSQYQSSGSLTSSIFNSTSAGNLITKLAWTDSGTSATERTAFQIRSSPDGLSWSGWCGASTLCDSTDYFLTGDNNINFTLGHPLKIGGNDKYFQYKAFLYSGGVATPQISSVGVSYDTGSIPSPAVISTVVINNITTVGATVSWTTDTPSDSYVHYSTSPILTSPATVGSATLTTSHVVNITGLTAGTQYYFEVHSTDASSQLSTDNNSGSYYNFLTETSPPPGGGGGGSGSGGGRGGGGGGGTPPNLSIPTVRADAATAITSNSATLNGFVDPNGISGTTRWFEWGGTPAMTEKTATSSQGSSSGLFSESISGLSPNTTYNFRVVAHNANGTAGSSPLSFKTPNVIDFQTPPAPVITISAYPSIVLALDTSVISYDAQDATQGCVKSGAWSGSTEGTGTYTTEPLAAGTYTFTLTCRGGLGRTTSRSTTVTSQDTIGGGGSDSGDSGTGGSGTGNSGGDGGVTNAVPPQINTNTEQAGRNGVAVILAEVKDITTNIINTSRKSITETKKKVVEFTDSPLGSVTTKAIVGSGSAAAVASLAGEAVTFSDISLAIFRMWNIFLLALGIRKRRSPWGTVYDSVTKQPLDPAYVVLQDQSGKEVGDAITDLDGRYGFLITSGSYQIIANKTNYSFPSKKLEGKTSDELYDNLYFGGDVFFDTNNVVIKNIPLDPVKFDWNEYAKRDQKLMMFYSKHSRIIALVSTILFRVGFVSAIALFASRPDNFNLIVLIIYGAIFLLHLFGFKPKTSGVITDSQTKKPLSFSIVRVYREGVKEEFTHRVADQYGRYYCLVPKGEYYVTIEKKNPDMSYTLIHTSGILNAKKGLINDMFEI